MKGLRSALEAARKKWCDEENAIEAKRQLVNEATVRKLLQNEERRKAFEARWNEVKARNLKALDEGTFEGPIVPIGLRPPEPPKQRASIGEGSAEKVSFLQLLDEPPEGVGKYSEGGSVGSGELPPAPPPKAPPPPEAPPHPEAPAPEAPVPEVAPSKAEEVKQRLAEAPARLEVEAYRALEDEFIAVAKPEDLRDVDKKFYEKVRSEGRGVCSRCRWLSGCQSCDGEKAWGYACRSTLWNTAHEAVRPKAKPKGRPTKAAAKA